MTRPGPPSSEQIQDYIDGRLGARDLAAMTTYLLSHPRVASEIEALRRHNQALKQIGQEVLDEPIPERLRNVLRRSHPGTVNGAKPGRFTASCHAALAFLICLI